MLSADLGSALLDAPRLTLRSRNEIMTGPGILRSLVGVVTDGSCHERLQPQGRRSLCTCKQVGSPGNRTPGERNRRTDRLSEPGSCAGRPSALHQGIACSVGKACGTGGFFGNQPGASQVRHSFPLNSTGLGHSVSSRLAVLAIFFLLPMLLTGCGEKKQARVNVPPPPPPIQPAQPAETPTEVVSNKVHS